jgi:hypothetical protein
LARPADSHTAPTHFSPIGNAKRKRSEKTRFYWEFEGFANSEWKRRASQILGLMVPWWAKGPTHTSLGQSPRLCDNLEISANGAVYEWQTANTNNIIREVFARYTCYMVEFQ